MRSGLSRFWRHKEVQEQATQIPRPLALLQGCLSLSLCLQPWIKTWACWHTLWIVCWDPLGADCCSLQSHSRVTLEDNVEGKCARGRLERWPQVEINAGLVHEQQLNFSQTTSASGRDWRINNKEISKKLQRCTSQNEHRGWGYLCSIRMLIQQTRWSVLWASISLFSQTPWCLLNRLMDSVEWGCLQRSHVGSTSRPAPPQGWPGCLLLSACSNNSRVHHWTPNMAWVPGETGSHLWQVDYIVTLLHEANVDLTLILEMELPFLSTVPFQHHQPLTYWILYSPSRYPTQCFWPKNSFPRKKMQQQANAHGVHWPYTIEKLLLFSSQLISAFMGAYTDFL